ncbi:hypothetical protein EV641_106191 [Rhodococcus sp. SMB37]|uniref:hypothetical protein n=1 Tax=Rhodococcus sp. SMB37 TaxID=2512213 RepID=UPI00104B53CC|nr:hypothetical protein [Rhodococcus sp. SMB37]TCN53545.1 hypothetical protein EV641_106191 [Rhodococcus sp. SMB37]
MTQVEAFYTAEELVALGYAEEGLREVFGDPDTTAAGEDRWSQETVIAIERDVLAPAARIIFGAFAPDLETRVGMIAGGLKFGWPQMEQLMGRVQVRADADREGALSTR